jgi:hypothetical protein
LVTGISIDEARRMALAAARADATAEEPVYVHDGAPGREAWLVVVHDPDRGIRQIFVTQAGTYTRGPGTEDREG